MDKPLLRFIWWSDSWGVDVLADYIVSSSALIPLAPKPGLHFHNIIPGRVARGTRCNPQMSWWVGDTIGLLKGGKKKQSSDLLPKGVRKEGRSVKG